MHAYKSLIQQYDVISFDLFDTLILRKCLYPTDAFNLVKKSSFKHARITLEKKARQFSRKEEITLDDIYKLLPDSTFLKNREIQVEKDLIYINEPVREILEYAKEIGKTVVLASDMYLNREILEEILKENEIPYDKFYLSSECGATKHTGKMYELIKNDYPEKRILHLDDRKDLCMKAESYGISTIQVPLLREKENVKYLVDKHDNIDYSVYSALVSQNRNNSFWYNVGYNYVGITTLAIQNLIEKDKDKFDVVLFLARDGSFPCNVYEHFKDEDDPEGVYFKTNRWLQRCYSVTENSTIDDKEMKYLVGYLGGLNIHDTDTLAKYLNIKNKEKNLLLKHNWSTNDAYEKRANLQDFFELHFEEIKARCLEIKSAYEEYLKPFKGKKVAIMDVGWNGSCLEFFEKAGINVVNAYFFGYFQNDPRVKFVYKEEKHRGNMWEYFSINVFENMFGATHGSYKNAERTNYIELAPYGTEFHELINFEEEINIYEIEFYKKREEIFLGAFCFIKDFIKLQRKYNIEISEELIKDIYNRLFNNPTLEEAEGLGSIIHYNGTEPTYVAKPSELALLNKSILDVELKNSTWHDGYVKILKDKYKISLDSCAETGYNSYTSKIEEFVKQNKGKKIACIGAGSFSKHLLENTSFKELDIVFLDNFRKEPLCGKPVTDLKTFLYSGYYDVCIWTMINTDIELENQYKVLNPIKIF